MDFGEITLIQVLLFFVFGGGFIGIIGLLWKISKRDSKIDLVESTLNKLEKKLDVELASPGKDSDQVIETISDVKKAEDQIINIEKDLIEIKTNQKNLLNSLDNQNFQILDLIDRLEKNHKAFIVAQSKINDKLENAIDAIKDSLINLSRIK